MEELTQDQIDELVKEQSPTYLAELQFDKMCKEELERKLATEKLLCDKKCIENDDIFGSPNKRVKFEKTQTLSAQKIQSDVHDTQHDEEEDDDDEIKLTQRQLEAHAIQAIFEDDLSELPAIDLHDPFQLPPITNKAEKKAVDALAVLLVSKDKAKLEKVPLYDIFPNILTHTTVLIAGHTKKVGKTALAYEIVSDILLRCPKKNIIYINVLQSYDAEEQSLIFEKQCKASNLESKDNTELSRVQVLEIGNYEQFRSLMNHLSEVVGKIPDVCLLVIDSLTFYHQESYHSADGITRQQYLEKHLAIFNKLAVDMSMTVLVTLPEHLMRIYNARNMVEESKRMSLHWKLMLEKHREKVKERAAKQLNRKVLNKINYNIDSSEESAAKIEKVESQEKSPATESEGSLSDVKSLKSDGDSQSLVKTISTDSSKEVDDDIDYEKLEMLYKPIEFNKIDIGLLIIQTRIASNLFKMRNYRGSELEDLSKKEEDFYFYRINCNGLEFRQRAVTDEKEEEEAKEEASEA